MRDKMHHRLSRGCCNINIRLNEMTPLCKPIADVSDCCMLMLVWCSATDILTPTIVYVTGWAILCGCCALMLCGVQPLVSTHTNYCICDRMGYTVGPDGQHHNHMPCSCSVLPGNPVFHRFCHLALPLSKLTCHASLK